ncbi:MAG TPA: PQQ-dependent sugar dehydrogenase [Burkholderiales bacterium]|nr:PQQ-dependent sugar dehydrogenase [Burkholderiales bacterium]
MRSLFAAIALLAATAALSQNLPLERIKLPPGFRIEVLAQVPNARSLALGAKGTLFVGSRSGGTVHAVLPDRSVVKVAEGLSMPNGVAFRDGALYIAEVGRIYKLAGVEDRLNATGMPELVFDKLPRDVHHGWKFIRFGPDGKLYVPIGAPCNVCNREGYALLGSLDLKTKEFQPYARGIRNTVGFDWDPATRELWFTDNGRDWLGDDRPADELNHAPRAGLHFGFPFCHQGDVQDPEFTGRRCPEFTPPARRLGPHVAALGMRFYTGAMFPAQYRNQIFIAEHGSWNRSSKVGYRVTLVRLDADRKPVSYEPFAEGWLQGQRAWGRPADVEVAPDGSLLIADDDAGAIYRVRYRG